jgi:uncharacterized paraquat-inducible protein A
MDVVMDHRAFCPQCRIVVSVMIGPAFSQHSCERCGTDLDPNFTKSTTHRLLNDSIPSAGGR